MSVNLKQNVDGSFGLQGRARLDGEFIPVVVEYIATSVDKVSALMTRPMRVKGIRGRVTVAGTDAGAVNATIRKVPSGTTIASGTALHIGTFDLKGTANTNQILTLASPTGGIPDLEVGDSIAADFAGVLTAATGAITVWLAPL